MDGNLAFLEDRRGLYGNNGILPAKLMIQRGTKHIGQLLLSDQPTLLRLFPLFGLNTELMIDLVCLVGMVMSSLSVVFVSLRCTPVYVLLWALYFSVYQVGETFLWFQWDILLLEVGVLTAIIAPLLPLVPLPRQHNGITLWLVRWLLFRLMFASSVVKLQSHCPTWWGLTALNYHFESQCISTPLAYYMHQLPDWMLKLGVVQTFVTQIAVSFLFFSPLRSLRLFAFWIHVAHQVLILLSGNYNFFNLLTIALCLSLLDDSCFQGNTSPQTQPHCPQNASPAQDESNPDRPDVQNPNPEHPDNPHQANPVQHHLGLSSWHLLWLDRAVQAVVYGVMVYYCVKYFSLRFDNYTLYSKIAFSKGDFEKLVKAALPITIWMGAISLAYEILCALIRCFTECLSPLGRLFRSSQCLVYAGIGVLMFSLSLVPHTMVDRPTQENLPHTVRSLFAKTHKLHLASSYGLFRRMTGVGGRPEVIIEGSNHPHNGWKEYDFLYKPGNLSTPPPFVAPHQPRLDWQMWFAALGSFQHNPWFLNLVYRLLTNQREVLDLLPSNPFPDSPPTYIRARLYHYHFADWTNGQRDWWKREEKSQYLPVLTKDDPNFVRYLRENKIIDGPAPRVPRKSAILSLVTWCRKASNRIDAFNFIIDLLVLSGLLNVLWKLLYRQLRSVDWS